jgi:hypothetical protein
VCVCVSDAFVEGVVISVVVDVGYLLGLADFDEGPCVVVNDVMVHVLFVWNDYCLRIIVV